MRTIVKLSKVFVAPILCIHVAHATAQPLQECVALRGNGNWVGAHFAGLARMLDDGHQIDALAGGSSSTVTAFIYESMLQNALVKSAPPKQQRQFLSLMLKTVYGYMNEVSCRCFVSLIINSTLFRFCRMYRKTDRSQRDSYKC